MILGSRLKVLKSVWTTSLRLGCLKGKNNDITMTKSEFLSEYTALLTRYCVNNKDYENIQHRDILKTDIPIKARSSVRVQLSTYLTATDE
jgi:hypothetical protein